MLLKTILGLEFPTNIVFETIFMSIIVILFVEVV